MKKITISLPDELIEEGRKYAAGHNTTLNNLIRQLLQETVMSDQEKAIKSLFEKMDKVKVKTNKKWTREEIYKR